MINGHDLGRLIELAFDYVSAESEQQAAQSLDGAAKLAKQETISFEVWLELTEYIREWNSSNGHNCSMSWASALQFLSARQIHSAAKPDQTTGTPLAEELVNG
jgi:hypothetical protein